MFLWTFFFFKENECIVQSHQDIETQTATQVATQATSQNATQVATSWNVTQTANQPAS